MVITGELDLEFLTTAVPQLPNPQAAAPVSQAVTTTPAAGQSLLIKREPNTTTAASPQPEISTSSIAVTTQV